LGCSNAVPNCARTLLSTPDRLHGAVLGHVSGTMAAVSRGGTRGSTWQQLKQLKLNHGVGHISKLNQLNFLQNLKEVGGPWTPCFRKSYKLNQKKIKA